MLVHGVPDVQVQQEVEERVHGGQVVQQLLLVHQNRALRHNRGECVHDTLNGGDGHFLLHDVSIRDSSLTPPPHLAVQLLEAQTARVDLQSRILVQRVRLILVVARLRLLLLAAT